MCVQIKGKKDVLFVMLTDWQSRSPGAAVRHQGVSQSLRSDVTSLRSILVYCVIFLFARMVRNKLKLVYGE